VSVSSHVIDQGAQVQWEKGVCLPTCGRRLENAAGFGATNQLQYTFHIFHRPKSWQARVARICTYASAKSTSNVY